MTDQFRALADKVAALESKCALITDIITENAVLRRRCDVLEARCASLELRCAEYDAARSVQVPEQLTRGSTSDETQGMNTITRKSCALPPVSSAINGHVSAPPKPNFVAPQNATRYTDSIMVARNAGSLPTPPEMAKTNAVPVPVSAGQQPFVRIVKPELRARPLLPRGVTTVVPHPSATQNDHQLELRIRKREANRRSDHKRLAREQKLREDTAVLEKKILGLRELEQKLKNENEELKRRVSHGTSAKQE